MQLATLLHPGPLFLLAALLRLVLLLYGIHQDATSALKYTDIDYLVFTDAARLPTPYDRETYRYTPLLAWLLRPTAPSSSSSSSSPGGLGLFVFGKLLFAAADLLAGWLLLRLLRSRGLPAPRAGAFAALWLWNPMVAAISPRGSSEGLLGALTAALVWAAERRRLRAAALLLGLGVHFKIYPFIYAPAIVWWMDDQTLGKGATGGDDDGEQVSVFTKALRFLSWERIEFTVISLATFAGLNALMYNIYGYPFLEHTFLHHVTRVDHRHNFSPYNVLLYQASASSASSPSPPTLRPESLAFVPQLLLSCVLIPFVLAKKDLATSMLAQTFAFVTFNKVCTSQYFLWYMIFLPLYLPTSSMLRAPRLGLSALLLWALYQAAWLRQGYKLEFLGASTFFPGLWLASLSFFLVNCWILGVIIVDGSVMGTRLKVRVN